MPPSSRNNRPGQAGQSPVLADPVLLAHVAGAHGIRGEVLLKTYTAAPEDIAAYGPLSNKDGAQFTVKVVRATPKGVIARLKGIDDRNAAEALKSIALYVDRSELPPPDDNEFYFADLIGLAAYNAEGMAIGTVVGVHDHGAGSMLDVKFTATGKSELVPFTKACVPVIDIAARRLTVVLPETTAGEPQQDEAAGDLPE